MGPRTLLAPLTGITPHYHKTRLLQKDTKFRLSEFRQHQNICWNQSGTCSSMLCGIVVEERSEEEGFGHVIRHVFCEERVLDSSNESFAEDDVRRLQIPHSDQSHGSVKMVDLRNMIRRQTSVLSQSCCFKVSSLFRHWPTVASWSVTDIPNSLLTRSISLYLLFLTI